MQFNLQKTSWRWGASGLMLTALFAMTTISGAWAQSSYTFGGGLLAQAPAPAPAVAKDKKLVKKHKAQRPPKVTHTGGESTAERNARLTRECKGRPNAGACEGFAR